MVFSKFNEEGWTIRKFMNIIQRCASHIGQTQIKLDIIGLTKLIKYLLSNLNDPTGLELCPQTYFKNVEIVSEEFNKF